jgi:hypothetical protein
MTDHIVQGQAIVSAAAYLELIFEVFKGEPIHIVSVRVLAPFMLTDDPSMMLTDFVPCAYAPHRYEFSIISRNHGDGTGESKVHCTGVVEKISRDMAEHLLPADLPPTI